MSNDAYRKSAVAPLSADEERARKVIAPELMRDENVIWAGQPKQGVYFSPADLLLIPFSLVWCSGAISWEVLVASHPPYFFALFGLPLVATGLYIAAGRFFVDAHTRARTFYAVTNRRVLILAAWPTRRVTSLDLAKCPEISLRERPDGTGTIFLGKRSRTGFIEDSSWPRKRRSGPVFRRIGDVRKVFESIQDARAVLLAKGDAVPSRSP